MGTEVLNDDLVKAFLSFNGWAWQEVTRNIWMKGGFPSRWISFARVWTYTMFVLCQSNHPMAKQSARIAKTTTQSPRFMMASQ
jgi:hypothetical protein